MAIKVERDAYSDERDAYTVVEYRGAPVRMWVIYRGTRDDCDRWARTCIKDKMMQWPIAK